MFSIVRFLLGAESQREYLIVVVSTFVSMTVLSLAIVLFWIQSMHHRVDALEKLHSINKVDTSK